MSSSRVWLDLGRTAKSSQAGIGAETARIFEDLQDVLGRAGASITDLVKISVYLTDAADFDAFNAVYAEHVGEEPPARVCVVSALTIDARVEMDFIAHIDS